MTTRTRARGPAGAPGPSPSSRPFPGGSRSRPDPRPGCRRARSSFLPVLALLLGALSPSAAADETLGNITTVAGTGTSGFSGDGGAATAARLNSPAGTALDGRFNLYIVDSFNNRIRKVDAGGTITTVAGTGTRGGAGDGGPATEAQLNIPVAVAVDDGGNLYIAESWGYRVRKVDAASGTITTVAGTGVRGFSGDGGPATEAQFQNAVDVAVDGSGNLYVADNNANRIRKVDAASGIITTVAGTGTFGFSGDGGSATGAQLNEPSGVAVDGRGNLYIADTANHRVRKVDAASGIITTVAGTGTAGFAGDGRPATEAQLHEPAGTALDGRGNLYIADSTNHRVRKVDAASGIITTVAGAGTAGYSGDGGPATEAQLNSPSKVALDGLGNFYIGDRSNHRVRRVLVAGTPPAWSATLTVDVEGEYRGCTAGVTNLDTCATGLSDNDFTIGDTTFVINALYRQRAAGNNPILVLGFENSGLVANAHPALRDLGLSVGSGPSWIIGRGTDLGGHVRWLGGRVGDITWSDDQEVQVSLGRFPGKPSDLAVLPGDGTLEVRWSAPANVGSAPITAYHVHYTTAPSTGDNAVNDDADSSGSDPAAAWVDVGHTGTATVQSIAATAGTQYRVRVLAENAYGISEWEFFKTTAGVLVSNLGQTRTAQLAAAAERAFAVGFTNAGERKYTLTGIEVVSGLSSEPSNANRGTIRAELWSAAAGGGPGSKIGENLTVPSTVAGDSTTFTAPAGTVLQPNTTYYFVTYTTGTEFNWSVAATVSNDEDAGAAAGFSIADAGHYVDSSGPGASTTWTEGTGKVALAVKGAVVPKTWKSPFGRSSRTENSALNARVELSEAAPAGGLTFTVTPLFGDDVPSGRCAGITGRATAADIGAVPATLTVAAGETVGRVEVPLLADLVSPESDECLVLRYAATQAVVDAGWSQAEPVNAGDEPDMLEIEIIHVTPFPAPTPLTVTAVSSGTPGLNVSWTAPTAPAPPLGGTQPAVAGYHVHYTSAPATGAGAVANDAPASGSDAAIGWVAVNRSGTGTTQAISLDPVKTYRTRVRAYSTEINNYPGFWAFGTATKTLAVLPPGDPRSPMTAPGHKRLDASWSAPAAASDKHPPSGYDVHYTSSATVSATATAGSDVAAGWVARSHAGTATAHALTNLANDTPYRWRVRARNNAGTSGWVEGPGGTPKRWVGFSTNEVLTEGETEGISIRVSEAFAAATTVALVAITGRTTATDADIAYPRSVTFPAGATRVSFTVQAHTDFDENEGSEELILRVAAPAAAPYRTSPDRTDFNSTIEIVIFDADAPGAPQDLAAAWGDGRVDLTWTPIAAGPEGYDVEYRRFGADWTDANHAGTDPSHAIAGLTNGAGYEVRVRWSHGGNAGEWATARGVPTAQKLTLETNREPAEGGPVVTLTARLAQPAAQARDIAIEATGTATAGLFPTPPVDWTGRPLTREVDGDVTRNMMRASIARGSRAASVTITVVDDDAEDPGETIVLAAWSEGDPLGDEPTGADLLPELTAHLTLTIADDDSAPGAPEDLAVTPGDARLDLAWTKPSGTTVTGYAVHHTSAPAAGAGAVDDDAAAAGGDPAAGWVDSGDPGNTPSHAIENLVNATAYRVRVRASNGEGDGPWAFGAGTPCDLATAADALVANLCRADGGSVGFDPAAAHAQPFATGAHVSGWALAAVDVLLAEPATADQAAALRAELWSADASGAPAAKIADLTVPQGELAAGVVSFAAPADTVLAAETTYHAVLHTDGAQAGPRLGATLADAEDFGAAAGWSVGDALLSGAAAEPSGTWTAAQDGAAVRIRVRGSAQPGEVPAASLWASADTMPEGGEVTLTVRLTSPAPEGGVYVRLSAPASAKYSMPYDVFLDGGRTSRSENGFAFQDSDTDDVTFTVSIDASALPSAVTLGSPSSVEITIKDDDLPTVSLSVSPATVDEGRPVTVTATLSEALDDDVSIPLTVGGGTAEAADLGALAAIAIGAGDTTGTGVIATNADADMDDETFEVSLGALPAAVAAGSPASVTVTINDVDTPVVVPTVELSAAPNPVAEGGRVTLTATLSSALSRSVTIPLTTTRDTSEANDHNTVTGIRVSGGRTSGTAVISTRQDTDTDDEAFTVKLGALPSTVAAGTATSVTVTIDDDDTPTVKLSVDPARVAEGDDVTVTGTLSGAAPAGGWTVGLTVTPDTAEAEDVGAPADLVFDAGDTTATVRIATNHDDDTDDERFEVAIDADSLPAELSAGSPSSARVTILDDDATVTLTVSPETVNEGSAVTVTVRLSRTLPEAATVPLSVTRETSEEGDHGTLAGIEIAAGRTSATGRIETAQDDDTEDETFSVGFGALPANLKAGTPSTAGVTIADGDAVATLTADALVKEGDSATVNVTLSRALSRTVTVPLAVTRDTAEEDDLGTVPGVRIGAGATSGTARIPTRQDDDTDDEAFEVALDEADLPDTVVAGTPSSARVVIDDDDAPAVDLYWDGNVAVEGETATFEVRLSASLPNAVTIPLTAEPAKPASYDAPSPVTIAAGRTSGTGRLVTKVDSDNLFENVKVALDEANLPAEVQAGRRPWRRIQIAEPAPVSLSASPNPVAEGSETTVTATLEWPMGADVTVPVSTTRNTSEDGDHGRITGIRVAQGEIRGTAAVATHEDADGDDEAFTVALVTANLPRLVKAGTPASVRIEIHEPRASGIGADVWLLPPASDAPRGAVRVANRGGSPGTATVVATDDAGRTYPPVTVSLGAHAAAEFGAADLERSTGPGQGAWRLAFASALDIEATAYAHAADGFAAPLDALLPAREDGTLEAALFEPAGAFEPRSLLRLVNPGTGEAHATVSGVDDLGRPGVAQVRLTIPAGAACTVDAAQLESGSGLPCGARQPGLGDGHGRWRLAVAADAPLVGLNLLAGADGRLANLSAARLPALGGAVRVPLFPAASEPSGRHGVVRVINRSDRAGTVRIEAADDTAASYAPLTLALAPGQAVDLDADDLELGGRAKGLAGSTGSGVGAWRLALTGDVAFTAHAYVRAADGFLTAVRPVRVAATDADSGAPRLRPVALLDGDRGVLRLANPGPVPAVATVRGVDDAGANPGEPVRIVVPARSAVELTAAQLGSGDAEAIVSGALGAGSGGWRLAVEADAELAAMSLLSGPGGHTAELSGARPEAAKTPREAEPPPREPGRDAGAAER